MQGRKQLSIIWIKLICSLLFKEHKFLSLQELSTSEIQDVQKSQDYILILVVKCDTQLCNAVRDFMSLTLNLIMLELKDPNNKIYPALPICPLILGSVLGA